MKLINFIIKSMCGFFILISFASCDDFLDRDPSDRITEEEVFQKIQTAEEYLNNAYTFYRTSKLVQKIWEDAIS